MNTLSFGKSLIVAGYAFICIRPLIDCAHAFELESCMTKSDSNECVRAMRCI